MVPYIGYAALIIQNRYIFIMLISILVLNIALNKLFDEDDDKETSSEKTNINYMS